MASPKRSSARRGKNISPEEIENLLADLEKYKKQEEADKKKHEQQQRKDTQANKKKVAREVQMASKEVRKKEMEVKKLQMGLAKVEQQEDQTMQKKARQNATIDEGIARLRKKFQDIETQLVQKVEESGKAHGWLAHVEFAQSMLEQTGKLLECEVDPNFQLEDDKAKAIEDVPAPEPPPEVVQEKVQLQKRTSRLQQENDRLRKEIEENRRIVQALEDSTNRFVAKRKAQAEENGAEKNLGASSSPQPQPVKTIVSDSPKIRPAVPVRSPSYPGQSIRFDSLGNYGNYQSSYGTGSSAIRVSVSPVSTNRQGYSGYASYVGSSSPTFTTAIGYSGAGIPGQSSVSPGMTGGYQGFGMVRPYSLPQLPTLGGGGPLSSPVAPSSLPGVTVMTRESGYPSAAGLGAPVSVSESARRVQSTSEAASLGPTVAATPQTAAPKRQEPAPRHGGRFQNAVRKVQAQALREYRDIIANDSNEM
eukprot:gnl/MRDRNA2_/MRDRNA2_93038_c0_seq1.p1 gnl/MRDRNA2_/MRDRNA2_93038_c0~~gnl/MRDRNA2_/MRDRNA2_93038_c0_seq1.p1  ORF type:complete len:477 (+),score=102.50 gnl/MRDRNA2_/MRDRNA2_93038_c0_seq1:114-1544(+)